DADAVFGMIYAQAEDDFNRVETNYMNSIGRAAETEGESAIWRDLRMKMFIDPAAIKQKYDSSPAWLKALMDAWADGLNFYLANHPDVKPKVITHFDPWMALTFSEGSIGGDIETINLNQLEAFYGRREAAAPNKDGTGITAVNHAQDARATEERDPTEDPGGSNGIAIAPSNTTGRHSLLLINPHTSFFFRSELQMSSDAGLNAYGAVTWGQFFIYQGFNANAGWMHTSSGVDNVDEFAETIVDGPSGSYSYRYGKVLRPVTIKTVTLSYRKTDGSMGTRSFTTYATHHGPIVREVDGKWIAFALMNRPVAALEQSFLRTKATDYASFLKV